MSKIVSIATSVPPYRHEQKNILSFMQNVYAMNEMEKRKLRFLYGQSAIDTRYSVLPDYSLKPNEWEMYPAAENLEPFPGLELRMQWFNKTAPSLSINAIEKCIENIIDTSEITHLITVSCTGISAPGLDLLIMETMNLSSTIFRTSINFMGCYAAIHALKIADTICKNDTNAKVLVVCTELCTLHFQKEKTIDNIASSLLFGDGSAAVLITHNDYEKKGLHIKNFYSEVAFKGKEDMSWQLSASGFLMTLSGYVPDLIEEDFSNLLEHALSHANMSKDDVSQWCIHPGGKRILTAIEKSIGVTPNDLEHSYDVLKNFGNMSSPTILFVLQKIMGSLAQKKEKPSNIFGAAFGPGLTLETFILSDE